MRKILIFGPIVVFGPCVFFMAVRAKDLTSYSCTRGVATVPDVDGRSGKVVMYLRKFGIPCSGTNHVGIQSGILYVPDRFVIKAENALATLAKAHPELGIAVEADLPTAEIPCG